MKQILTVLFSIICIPILFSQNTDCVNAIPICQSNYSISTPQGVGNQANELNSNSCLSGENNSTWFLITPQTNGTLSFVVSPNDVNENFNWSLYNITNANCADIATNANLEIACNNSADLNGSFNDAFGQTGAYTNQPWYGGIFAFYPSFEGDINVNAGETYILYVNNTTANSQGQGFNIDFTNSTATLFNSLPPTIDSVIVPNCGATTFNVYFNKPILCSSVIVSDFNLQVGGSNLQPVSVSSVNCAASANSSDAVYTLTFANPLLPNNYTFQLVNSVSDFCGNVLNNQNVPLNVPNLAVDAGNDISVCNAQSINQIIGMTGFYPNQTFQWSAEPTNYLSALSSTTNSAVTLNIPNAPIDTIRYILTTNAGNGCTTSDTMFVYGSDCCANFDASITNYTNIGCFGTSTGQATVTISGSLSPSYTYNWNTNPQQFSAIASGLSANQNYIVTVTDGNQCQDTASVILSEPAAPITVLTTGVNVTCFGGNNGSINLTVNGGTQPYNYIWSNNTITQDLSNIPAGNYQVTVSDANNCTITAQRTINQPSTPLVGTTNSLSTFCNQANGLINLNVSGGSSPYFINWSNNLGSGLSQNNLVAGTYFITITDVANCSIIVSETVNSTTVFSASTIINNATCDFSPDGSINLSVSGGQSPYTFNWDNSLGNVQSPTNLLPNTYSVTVTDANGCLTTTSATVGSNGTMEATAFGTNNLCQNTVNGSINLTINGGQAPFNFSWTNGIGNIQNPINLAANTYTVTVTDGGGCVDTAQAIITAPPTLFANSIVTAVSCFNGNDAQIQASAFGGTPPYTINWQNFANNNYLQQNLSAGTYNWTISDANNCQTPQSATISQPSNPISISLTQNGVTCFNGNNGSIQTTASGGVVPLSFAWSNNAITQNINNLSAGNYTITVTDGNGCTATETIQITQPNQLTGTILSTNLTCFNANNGSIQTSISGGNAPYNYIWSNNATTANLNNLPIGNYSVTISDANNCTINLSTSITQPQQLNLSTIGINPTCFNATDGSIQTMISGGNLPYTFNWNNGIGNIQNPQNIGAGTYNLTVIDANNCTANATVTITQPTGITTTFNNTAATCASSADGNISMTISGGTSPYNYTWSNGLGNVQNPQNVAAGIYSVTITDANNCQTISSTSVNSPALLTVSTINMPPACGQNGRITAAAAGGVAPYNYTWSANANTGNSNIANNLLGGNYTVTVTDANSCTAISNVIIFTSSSNLIVTSSVLQPNCQLNSGVIGVSPISGVAPFTFNWSANANTINQSTATNLIGGNYSVTVTDNFGCDTIMNFTLNIPTVLTGNATVSNTTCGEINGAITYTVTSGTAPYIYSWSNTTNNTNTIDNLAAGSYTLAISDASNCNLTESFAVAPSDSLSVAVSITQPGCDDVGSINLSIAGGNSPFNYTWSNNANTGNTGTATNLDGGNYFVTISDINNCETTANFELQEIIPFELETVEIINNECSNGNDGSIEITSINASNPITYNWSNGGNSTLVTNLIAGNYSVTATDNMTNCQVTENYEIIEPLSFTIDIGNSFTVIAGTEITLQVNNPIAGVNYVWTASNGFTDSGISITTVASEAATYVVTGSQDNCPPVTSEITVKVTIDGELEVPNAFSPNGDGKNDLFRVATDLSIEIVDFKVFSRWGNLIYDSIDGEWDGKNNGKNAPNGAYVYLIEIITPDGQKQVFKGEIILVR